MMKEKTLTAGEFPSSGNECSPKPYDGKLSVFIPFLDRAWKIAFISVIFSVGVSSVATYILSPLAVWIGALIALCCAAPISYFIGAIWLRYKVIIEEKNEELTRLYEELGIEKLRSEALLLNVLPRAIAERLKGGQYPIADRFEDVTVLFCDIVGFTPLSSHVAPEALVELLNKVFSDFDCLTQEYGLEKIKTIGDAYMVVAGLPSPRSDHAQAIACAALNMQKAIERYNAENGYELSLRIGIHSGPVVAGVIGTQKFAYDVWGDTVNIASRMEAFGEPGRVQVSEKTHELLMGEYEFSEKHLVEVKGKGLMGTYFLVCEKA